MSTHSTFARIATGLLAGSAAASALAQNAIYQDKAYGFVPVGETAPDGAAVMHTGAFRIERVVRITPGQVGLAAAEVMKSPRVDPATGDVLISTPRFYLPENWSWGGAPAEAADSLARPIVSHPIGWNGWTQADVDALRAVIDEYAARRLSLGSTIADSRELDSHLGNYIGQAIVRAISTEDIVSLMDDAIVNATVAAAILERMNAYEQARYEATTMSGGGYVASVYPESVVQFVAAQGYTMEQLLAISPAGSGEGAGSRATPSGCYVRLPGAGLGLNLLVDATPIWVGDNTDDAQADVPIGFPMSFYQCEDSDYNTSVRVSSNGYVSFYQQGGGATVGTAFTNPPIGDTTAPNGFVAGWWDDLQIMPNQSNIVDRVSWKIEGGIGARVLIIEYLSVSRRGGDTTDYHTFQILLHEQRQNIAARCPVTVAYTGIPSDWQSDSIDAATIGLENFDGTDGECLETCDLATDIPARNYTFYPSPNDLCANARPIFDGIPLTGDLRFAYNDANTCNSANADQWYQFYAPCAGTLTIDTCGTNDFPLEDAGIDTIISAHTACPGGAGITLGCDDDGGSNCGDTGLVRDSRLVLNLATAQRVYIRVTSFQPAGASGFYIVRADFDSTGAAPTNDACVNAAQITAPQTTTGNLLCATADGSDICNVSTGNRDVWYRFTAPLGGSLRVTSCGTHDGLGIDGGMDSVLSLHSGCPGNSANTIECNDDAFGGCGGADEGVPFDSVVIGRVEAGQSVLVRVSYFISSVADGEYQIHTAFLTADLNADCQVSLSDLTLLLSTFGQIGGSPDGDINGDNQVSLSDLTLMLSHFGESCP